jgi:hypothetical protein
MNRFIALAFIWLLTASATLQGGLPDLNKPEDIAELGKGKIIENDNSIIKQITLKEIREHWIVYVKNQSLHDKHMESIRRIEFPESKWGRIKIEFPNNKAEASLLPY